jgi:predicted cupin superfamily sugar epimerase
MPENVTADEIKTLLKLEPNATCGFVRETYKSDLSIAPGGLPAPFADGRPLGTALYFMVTPAAPVKLHRIKNEQLYHYYLGDPIEVLMLRNNGDSELVVVGPNIVGGELLQLFIPGDTFHTARVTGKRRWFLGASTEWPGVVQRDKDAELGDADVLAAKYPESAADIRDFPKPTEPPKPPKPEPVKEPESAKCPEPADSTKPPKPLEPAKPSKP